MEDWFLKNCESTDITFCVNECKRKGCQRHWDSKLAIKAKVKGQYKHMAFFICASQTEAN